MNISHGKYKPCKEWAAKMIDEGLSWDELKEYGTDIDNLNELKEDLLFPDELTPETWCEFIDSYSSLLTTFRKKEGEKVIAIDRGGLSNAFNLPTGYSSSWEMYKNYLNDKMSPESIADLEKSCLWILNHLSIDTREIGEVKGLVTGSVQSGKTANMEGLISMAADYDWNFFIVLSGTIDNLRKQTRDRFRADLRNSEGILWNVLDFTAEDKHFSEDELKLNSLSAGKNFSNRYLTVCLKNRMRLEKLIDWLYSDPKRTNKLRIVVIDDEADQASINTAEITPDEEQERCAINQMIVNLVNGRKSDGSIPETKVQSMNYIAYTATPYANVLNEAPGESLYPKDFICTLPEAHEYFGAKVVFGNEEEGAVGFPIVRNISSKDETELKKLHKGETRILPDSFKKALAWFLCAAALQRKRNYKKPVSMLIHTASIQNYHFIVYECVLNWLNQKAEVMELCKSVYDEEKNSVTLEDLLLANPKYGFTSQVKTEYPSFDELRNEISGLLAEIVNIELGEDKTLEYGKGIHLCVDNCKANKVAEEGTFLRIVYPTSEQLANMSKAPVFIVIGGNTLSRGLTIEGLVCTYFSRTSNLADTLMQMARWFGYRKGYELLQRIWMTDSVVEKFEALTKVDMDLKREVERFMKKGISPEKFGPRIRNIPEIAKFRITSKRKSQLAEYDDFDFCGDSYETTDFCDNQELDKNLLITTQFIDFLNQKKKCRRSDAAKAWIWDDILYNDIDNSFLSKYIISEFSSLKKDLPYFGQWMNSMNSDGKFLYWNVAVVDGENHDETWMVDMEKSVGLIERSRKLDKKKRNSSWIDIGALRSGLDALSDVNTEKLTEEQKEKFKQVCKSRKDIISERCNLGLEDKPLLLIYRIKKDGGIPKKRSENTREKLDVHSDIIGISIIVSGDSIGESHAKSLRIRM